MSRVSSEGRTPKRVLLWPTTIPVHIRGFFAVVFMNISALVQYVSKETDTFQLFISADYFKQLQDNRVYQFANVTHIEVVGDSVSDLNRIERCFPSISAKVHFCTLHDALKQLMEAAIGSSGPIDRNIINDITSLMEARLQNKKQTIYSRLFSASNQSTSKRLHVLPVKYITDFIPNSTCSSCKLVYQKPYQLECKHYQCGGCINIQKR